MNAFYSEYSLFQILFMKKAASAGILVLSEAAFDALERAGVSPLDYAISKCLFCFFLHSAEDRIYDDAEDQCGCDRCDGDSTEVEGQAADTCDEDNRSGEEVTVIVEVYGLKHLKTGYCDETVE